MDSLQRLLDIMRRLRDPQHGCPWDVAQDFASIAPYTVEEAYEVADAIERQDMEDLRGELGDLLLQVVFHAQMASERGLFDFAEVAAEIADKMVRRHPHVFGDAEFTSAGEQRAAWEDQKAAERAARSAAAGALDGVSPNLPALTWATKTGKRAARVGFDWPDAGGAQAKVAEELDELSSACAAGARAEQEEELGDLLLAITSLARHLRIDPEQALRRANRKFERRFRAVEARVRALDKDWNDCTLAELEALWDAVKRTES
ncbi:MAG: nucleoside triphosphate pyrophosphohydrolase [Gammaproteobacteria bacterium]|jgi:MazG family protein|nr:nucleoside triphosphate pyrophosphohydrolase [Gammaproteobacteria bacterium]